MKTSGNRLVYFLFGVTLGLLVGAGFFIFKIDEYVSRLELFKAQPDTVVTIHEEPEKNKKRNKDPMNVVRQKPGPDTADTKRNYDTLITDKTITSTDSLVKDSLDVIEVKKDQLLQSSTISVTNLHADKKNQKDSLLQNVSGVRDDSKNQVGSLQVEFWQSPVNYKGYKMTRSKLVVFGLLPTDVQIYRLDDFFYMRHQQNVFRLEFTSEFRGLEKVYDQSIIAKLN